MRNWIFVKVHTDQPGLYGWGEATLEWHTRAVMGAIEDISQLAVEVGPARGRVHSGVLKQTAAGDVKYSWRGMFYLWCQFLVDLVRL